MRLILASASPRRAELLTAAGYTFEVRVSSVDERRLAGESADAYVRRLAMEKAASVMEQLPARDDVVVLGADTVVVVDGDVLGKPESDADARAMLERLSGRAHTVLTGVCLNARDADPIVAVEATTVFFDELGDVDVHWYVLSGEGRDKAGAYAIQGLASRFIPRIEGSYSNVVGLPVATVAGLLKSVGASRSPA